MFADQSDKPPHCGKRDFATTRWSIVLAAGRDSSPEAKTALATLCETYWFPLYAFVRRQGYDAQDAQDLTQGFFTRLLEKKDLRDVQRERGKFRSFLLASMKHFLMNEWDRRKAEKRGGGQRMLSVDFDEAESRLRLEPSHEQTPEVIFEKQWALTLLDRVRAVLREEFVRAHKAEQFDRLHIYLTGEKPAVTYAEVAEDLRISEAAVKMAVSRLRRRFHDRLRTEIAQTVATEDEVDDEIQALIDALQT
jgi:RNA polymerase sigma-70 factor (ECF subfamily)